jgi:hypothetical protein
MTADEAVLAVIDALEAAGIPFMVVGSLASNFHGIPRSTRDADFVIGMAPGRLQRLEAELPDDLTLQPQVSFEGVTGTVRHLIVLAGSHFVCELFALSDDPHDRARFERRQEVSMLGRRVFIASAEDIVITKLRWARDGWRMKDRDDVRNVLAVRGDELDWDYVRHWVNAHETADLLADILRSLP